MSLRPKRRLGEALVDQGVITESQLKEALASQKATGGRLGATLVRKGYVSEADILGVLQTQYNIQRLDVDKVAIDVDAVNKVPESMVKRHRVFPVALVGKSRDRLILAMVDPLNVFAIDDVEINTGLDVQPVLVSEEEMDGFINRFYGALSAAKEALGRDDKESADASEQVDEDEVNLMANEAPIVKLVNGIIYDAVKKGASDIHIEPREDDLRVRFRVDGVLSSEMTTSKQYTPGIVSRIKIMAGMDITERRVPQDGRIKRRIDSNDVDFRVSTMPIIYGEKITIRILDKSRLELKPQELGFCDRDLKGFRQLLDRSYGLVFMAGPTGSGKTTTLYSAVSEVNSDEVNLITVENPVEFRIEGINQVEVNDRVGLTFARALRSFLRQDPNIIAVGEVRDRETADIAVQAALTGHLVLSTVHTNDAVSTVGRLIDMGIEPFLVASSLAGVVSQRLVRRVCSSCKETYTLDLATRLRFEAGLALDPGTLESKELSRGKGCQRCNQTGYKGRIGIYEVLVINDSLRRLILQGADSSELRDQAVRDGLRSIREDGLEKVYLGLTTPDELMKTLNTMD